MGGNLTTKTFVDNPFSDDPADSAIVAQGRVALTARYLNINGLIQSGVQTLTLRVDESFAPVGTTSLLDTEGEPVAGISFGLGGAPIDGYFDAEQQTIVVDEIVAKGGEIVVAGQILSTGQGNSESLTAT